MARNKRQPSYGGPPLGAKHVRLDEYMMQSEAWQALTLPARCLWIELARLHNGHNNGEIYLSVRDASRRLSVGKNTANKLFRELEALGFIKPRQRGAFSMKARHATTWILTTYGLPHDPMPTKEYMRWRPESPNEKQNTVPERGTDCPPKRDRERKAVPQGGTDGPRERDRERQIATVRGPRGRDTISLPCTPAPAGAAEAQRPDDTGMMHIEDMLARINAADHNGPSPQERLRERAKQYLDTDPPRGITGLAGKIGLSRVRLSNWLAGRDANLSHGPTVALREFLDSNQSVASVERMRNAV